MEEKDSNFVNRTTTEKSYLPKISEKKWNNHNVKFHFVVYQKKIYISISNQFLKYKYYR